MTKRKQPRREEPQEQEQSQLNAFEQFGQDYNQSRLVSEYTQQFKEDNTNENILEYAVNYARENIIGLDQLLRDPVAIEEIKGRPRVINSYLNTAQRGFESRLDSTYDNSRNEVIRAAPDNALAEIFYIFEPVERKGKGIGEHNEAAKVHSTFYELNSLLEDVITEKKDPKVLLEPVIRNLKKIIIDEGYKDDPVLRDDKQYKNLAFNAAYQTILTTRNAPIVIARSLRDDAKEELDKKLPDVPARASYARDTLSELAKNPEKKENVKDYLGKTYLLSKRLAA